MADLTALAGELGLEVGHERLEVPVPAQLSAQALA